MIIETDAGVLTGFIGGRVSLDFANSMHGRLSAEPCDELTSYEELVSWVHRRGVVDAREWRALIASASSRTSHAKAALKRARLLRDALYLVFSATANNRTPPESQFSILRKELARALNHLQIVTGKKWVKWEWAADDKSLDCILWPIAHSAANLLTSDELVRVRECAMEPCTWLFLDTSKSGRRRWCDMKSCGNRSKFRRYYKRRQLDEHHST